MSQANVEAVRHAFEAQARRDRAVLDAYHPDVEMDFSRSPFTDFVTAGRARGLAEVERLFRDFYEAFENAEAVISELVDAGDHVVSVFTYRATGRTSGVEAQWKNMAGVWTFRDGRIARVEWLRTREQALEAAEMPDP